MKTVIKVMLRVFRASALCWSLGMALACAGVAEAGSQYTLGCVYCHRMPPVDAEPGEKDPTSGAFSGSHQGHGTAAMTSCAKCHNDGVNRVESYDSSHGDGIIQLSDSLGYSRKPVGGFLNQTSVPPNPLGTCSTVACHSDGKGRLAASPAWGSAALQQPADCNRCHGVAPATGNHPTAGSKHAAYFGTATGSCRNCHADHAGEAKPFAHATSAGRAIEVKFAGSGSFAGNQCSTVYCHSNGKGSFSAPTWGATLDCSGCHGTAVAGGAAALSAKHAKHVNNAGYLGTDYGCAECHAATVSDNSTIADRSKHTDGSVQIAGARVGSFSAGSCATSYCHSDGKGTQKPVAWNQPEPLGCNGCHGSATGKAGEPTYVGANSHGKHVNSAGDCANCHSKTTGNGSSILAGGQHIDGFINYTAGNGKSFGKGANATCSNISCHSGGGIVKNVATARWGATLDCSGCHSTLTASHGVHTSLYDCASCHADTVSSDTAIANPVNHLNNAVNVAGARITSYTSGDHSCATSCHFSGTPKWNQPFTGQCGSCHNVTGPLISSNAHASHFTAEKGPKFPLQTVSCQNCHFYLGERTDPHADGAVDLNPGYAVDGACDSCHRQSSTRWRNAASVTCESCHSTVGGALSEIYGKTAPNKTSAATTGHGKAGIAVSCGVCHNSSSAHIGVVGGNKRVFDNYSSGTGCNACHDKPAVVAKESYRGMKVHKASGPGSRCADCHDPHGTNNSMMVKGSINGTSVSYTGTGSFANEQQTGVCQVCHSSTQHFTKAGITPPQAHSDSDANCLECHKHNPATGLAFAPNGACDACHGYPPAPRKVLNAVSYGVQGNWSSARFEDYSGGGGAHLIARHVPKNAKASDGWLHCLPCHSGGADAHARVLPIRSHVESVSVSLQRKYRFSNKHFSGYTGATLASGGANTTGTCFNARCHLSPSPKWSIER